MESSSHRITQIRVRQARLVAQLGIDVLRLGDDVGSQKGMLISPALWRKWLKPKLAKVIDLAKKTNPKVFIFYHSDGNIMEIIPDLIEIGVELLNPIQPECMGPKEIKRLYGDKLSLWGTIGTQSTMPFSTPEEVSAIVKERIETLGGDGGLILAPTHVLEPEVLWENILAFVEAIKEG